MVGAEPPVGLQNLPDQLVGDHRTCAPRIDHGDVVTRR
jgi:hypothetical protein